MANANSTLTLDQDAIASIRDMLLIGLAAFGEVKRLSSTQTAYSATGETVKEDLRVIHPTGAPDTVSRFADTLRMLC